MKIEVLLQKKGHNVVTVKPGDTVFDAAEALRKHRIGCVVVSEDGKHIDGLVAVRDVVYALAERAQRLRRARAADILSMAIDRIMTHEVQCCSPQSTLRQVMGAMTKHHILHVPVLENGELCGIVSIDDVVKFAVQEMDLEKEVLQESMLLLRTAKDMS